MAQSDKLPTEKILASSDEREREIIALLALGYIIRDTVAGEKAAPGDAVDRAHRLLTVVDFKQLKRAS